MLELKDVTKEFGTKKAVNKLAFKLNNGKAIKIGVILRSRYSLILKSPLISKAI